jgi:hypothetical protein
MGTGFGAIGFAGALPAGTYAFWIQQLAVLSPTQYTFSFVVVPEPSTLGMLLVIAAAGSKRR